MDYFKTLWSRFKKKSKLIDNNTTIYSFRHSGAIDIFKRTGVATKLQKAMGHSSINVSLTYLRGLQLPELTEGICRALKLSSYSTNNPEISDFKVCKSLSSNPDFHPD